MQCLVDRRVSEAGERLQQRVARHRSCVIVTALILVERIADVSLVPASNRFDDLQSLIDQPLSNTVGGDLVLDSGPNFVGIDKWQRRFVSPRPRAEQKSTFVAQGIAGTLKARMLAQILPEIELEDASEMRLDILFVERSIDAVNLGHPCPDNAVRNTSGAVLILRTFVFQQHRNLVGGAVGWNGFQHVCERGVFQPLILDVVLVILAVKEGGIEILCSLFRDLGVVVVVSITNRLAHVGKRATSAHIDTAAHAVRTPKLDVVGVVMGLKQRTLMRWIPGLDAVIEASLGQRVELLEPFGITRYLPLAPQLHDSTKLTVGRGVEAVSCVPVGKRATEVDMSARVHRSHILLLSKRAFEGGEQMRDCLGIVPHVGATAVTTAGRREATFPAPEISAGLTEDSRRLDDRKIARDCIDDNRRKR